MNRSCFPLLKSVAFVVAIHSWLAASVLADSPTQAVTPAELEFTLRSRDAETGVEATKVLKIDSRRVAIVMVDTWNFHWCLTATERCGCFAGRFNQALPALRKLGIQIFWCPTDVADQYVGTPQRELAIARADHQLPSSLNIPFARIECFESNKCMCGPGIKCQYNYGWDALAPSLAVAAEDVMPEGTQQLYSACKDRGITHLIYFGFHTNICTTGKPVGIRAMANAGLHCILARDMTDAISGYEPASGHHPDTNTEEVIATIERQVPTVDIEYELSRLGLWTKEPVNPVRIAPWGTSARPYLFESETTVSLTAPQNPGARIHYTLDGTAPTTETARYGSPLVVQETTDLRAVAFDTQGMPVCTESAGKFVKLPPIPPTPDVYLSEITPLRATCSGFHAFGSTIRPRMNRSYTGKKISQRGEIYEKGVGVFAPSQLLYVIEPEFRRFVGRLGIDESEQENDMARAIAIYPSVKGLVLIDGKPVAESPLMRYQLEPWRFDVEIPEGSRTISLVVTDGGNGNRHDLANWINAGFLTVEKPTENAN